MAIEFRHLDELANRIASLMPGDASAAREDMQRQVRSVLNTGLSKMDLVTRDDFEVQQKILLKTRQKLEALEARLAELESG